MQPTEEEKVTPFLDLPFELKKLLIKEFLIYVFHQTKFRHYVMFFSFWALAYQTRNLVATYLDFLTVVKVEISKPFTIDIPGTTICLDKYHMVLKSRLEERYPQIKERIREQNLTDENEIIEIYRKYKQIAYDNSTVGEWFSLLVEPQMILNCKLIILPKYFVDNNLTYPDCDTFTEPYYSLPYGAGHCWTYFSQINPNNYTPYYEAKDWYRVDIPEEGKLASFTVNYEIFKDIVYDDAPPTLENEYNKPEVYVIVHHPKALPSSISLDKGVVRPGTNFEIFFSQTNAIMLRWPYATDCIHYEYETYWKNYKSSAHCIDDCLSNKVIKECNCIFRQSKGGRITKWVKNDSDYKFCNEYELGDKDPYPEQDTKPRSCAHRDNYEARKTKCNIEGHCNNHCFEEFYRYEIKEVFFDEDEDGRNLTWDDDFRTNAQPLFPKVRKNDSGSTINIIRKDMVDVTYEHTPEMLFVEFVCYFGGLLGLWLGISILDMYHQCLIWWDEVPIEYRKWLQRQRIKTNVETFSPHKDSISIISSNNYNNNIRNIYNTKYEY